MIAGVRQKKTKLAPGCVLTLQELSLAAGVSRRTVSDWAKLPDFPREADGSISVWKVAQWHFERTHKPPEESNGHSRIGRLKREKLRLENADRRLKLMERAGQVVSRATALSVMRQFAATVKTRLLAIPAEVTSSIPPEHRAEVISNMEQAIRLVLRELAGLWTHFKGGDDDGNGTPHGA